MYSKFGQTDMSQEFKGLIRMAINTWKVNTDIYEDET